MIFKKCKIAFFGASVTAQSGGFASMFKNFGYKCKIFGYGGMHLCDAGVCYIDYVLKYRPDICFIDWFSTGYNICGKETLEYLETIVYKLVKAKCKPVFLFLPHKNKETRSAFYKYCKKFLDDKNLPYLDICEHIKADEIDSILRDDVHTTDYGSKLYAGIIKFWYEENKNSLIFPKDIIKTKYVNIKALNVYKEFYKKLILQGSCRIVGIEAIVGPYSGMVHILGEKTNYKVNIWDRWCHYTRDHFILPLMLENRLEIFILDDKFDTSSCMEKVDFSKEKKKLVVKRIFYLGKNVSVVNKNDGKRIDGVENLKINILGRIKQKLRKRYAG